MNKIKQLLQERLILKITKASRGNGFYDFNIRTLNTINKKNNVDRVAEQYLKGEVKLEVFDNAVDLWLKVVFAETKIAWLKKWNYKETPRKIVHDDFRPKNEIDYLNERALKWFKGERSWRTEFHRNTLSTKVRDKMEEVYETWKSKPKKRKVYTKKKRAKDEKEKWQKTQKSPLDKMSSD